MILSCAPLNPWLLPMRLAGTCRQYSKNAISQLTAITFHSATPLYFRWPYQAKVMNTFDRISRTMVAMPVLSSTPPRPVQCAHAEGEHAHDLRSEESAATGRVLP